MRSNWQHKSITFVIVCSLSIIYLTACFKNNSDGKIQIEQISTVNASIQALKDGEEYQGVDIETQTELVLNQIKEHAKQGLVKEDTIKCDERNHVITFIYIVFNKFIYIIVSLL